MRVFDAKHSSERPLREGMDPKLRLVEMNFRYDWLALVRWLVV